MFSKIVKYIEFILNTGTLVLWYSSTPVLQYSSTPVLQYSSTLRKKPTHFIVAEVNTNWNIRGGLAVQQ